MANAAGGDMSPTSNEVARLASRLCCDVTAVGPDAAHGVNVKLIGFRYNCHMLHSSVEVTIKQRYRNFGDTELNVACSVALAEGHVLTDIQVCLDGRQLHRVVTELESAQRQRASVPGRELPEGITLPDCLLDVELSFMCAQLGMLGPGREVELVVTYAMECEVDGAYLMVRLPVGVDRERFLPIEQSSRNSQKLQTDQPSPDAELQLREQLTDSVSQSEQLSDSSPCDVKNPASYTTDKHLEEESGAGDGRIFTAKESGEVENCKPDKASPGEKQEEEKTKKPAFYRSKVPRGVSLWLKAILPSTVTHMMSNVNKDLLLIRSYATDPKSIRAQLHATSEEDVFKEDITIKVQCVGMKQPMGCIVSPLPGLGASAAAVLSFITEFELDADEGGFCGELIFMVDRSGSMGRLARSGSSVTLMDQCKEALLLFLHSLPPGCFFNIIGFGTRRDRLFPTSTLYNKDSLDRASKYVVAMKNNFNGTDILRPLSEILEKKPATENTPRAVFLLTDGAVDAKEANEIIGKVRQHATSTRVFTVGIGADAGKRLLRGIARTGGGEVCFLKHGDPALAEKVVQQLRDALMPTLCKPIIDWGNLAVQNQSPRAGGLLPVYSNKPYTVRALLHPKSELRGKVKLSGKINGRQVSYSVEMQPVVDAERQQWKFIHRLTAAAQIADLETKLHDAEPIMTRSERVQIRQQVLPEICALAFTYGLMSSETMQVVAEASGNIQSLPRVLANPQVSLPVTPIIERKIPPEADKVVEEDNRKVPVKQPIKTDMLHPSHSFSEHDQFHQIIALQDACGLWPGQLKLTPFLQADTDKLCSLADKTLALEDVPSLLRASICATVAALAYLEKTCAKRRVSWVLLAEKALHEITVRLTELPGNQHLLTGKEIRQHIEGWVKRAMQII